jgi:nucleosome binding factor SPN SPT16 subunit
LEEDDLYKRSIVLHQWLFGYELPDTIVLITGEGHVWVCATKKKCDFIKPAIDQDEDFKIHLLLRNKEDNNASNYDKLLKQAHARGSDSNKVGVILKERQLNKSNGGIVGGFEDQLDAQAEEKLIELVDVAPAIALVMGQKDDDEQDLMKKSSVLSNKVMKHGFAKRLEEIIEEETTLTHDELAGEIDKILEDPNKINLKLPESDVSACYYPIIQSGGNYDIRISAQSTTQTLKPDIIIASLGARYKMYCSNITRTFLVDPPKKVSETYELLLEMQEACLKQMKPGNQLKAVYKAAVAYLQESGREDLISHLPKVLGFSQGLDFRDATLSLSSKNGVTFKKGMTFCLSVGFQNLELSSSDKEDTPDKSAVSTRSLAATNDRTICVIELTSPIAWF